MVARWIKSAGIVTAALIISNCDAGAFVEPGIEDGEPGDSTGVLVEVASLTLDSIPSFITEDDTIPFRAIARDADGQQIDSVDTEWSSTDEDVAHVESTGGTEGTLLARSPGTTTITASYEELSSSTTIQVHKRPVDLVHISGSGQVAAAGAQLPDSLLVRVIDKRGDPVSDVQVTFSVVSGGGTVSSPSGVTDGAGRLGTVWTLGTSGEQTVEARVSDAQPRVKQVKDSVVVFTAELGDTTTTADVASVTITPDSMTVEEDSTVQLHAEVKDSNSNHVANPSIKWTSADTTVARVDGNGLVTANAKGQVIVSASADGVSGSAAITVVGSELGSLTISPADTLHGAGDTTTLTVEARAANGSLIADPDVQWSSLDTTIATVDTMGLVTARALGIVTIAASAICCDAGFQLVAVEDTLLAGSASATAGDGQVSLSATSPAGGTPPYTYKWHRSPSSGFSPEPGNALTDLTSLNESDTAVTNGTTYYYRLVASDAAAGSVAYDEVSATPSDVAPWFEEDFSAYTTIDDWTTDVRGINTTTLYPANVALDTSIKEAGYDHSFRVTYPDQTAETDRLAIIYGNVTDAGWIIGEGLTFGNGVTGTLNDIYYSGGSTKLEYAAASLGTGSVTGDKSGTTDSADETKASVRCTDHTQTVGFDLPSVQTELWVEWRWRVESTFETIMPDAWGCGSNPDWKFMFITTDATGDGQARWEYLANSQAQHWINGPKYTSWSDPDVDMWLGPVDSARDFWDDSWHTFRMHVKHSSSEGVADGVLEFWADGVLVKRITGFDTGQSRQMQRFEWAHNLNQGPAHDQSVWMQWIRLYNTDPGW